MKNLMKALGAAVIALTVVSALIGNPNEQKKEYKGIVVSNFNGSSKVIISELEAPFKQTIKSEEEVVTAKVLAVNGKIVEAQQGNTIYRTTIDKVESKSESKNILKGQEVQISVIPKITNEITIEGVYNPLSVLSFRTNLTDAITQRFDREGNPILKLNVPITKTSEEELKVKTDVIIVSNGKANTISHCNGVYTSLQEGKHHEDGVYKVDETNKKLIALPPSSISEAPCFELDGDKYDSSSALFAALPMTEKQDNTFPLLFVVGLGIVVPMGLTLIKGD